MIKSPNNCFSKTAHRLTRNDQQLSRDNPSKVYTICFTNQYKRFFFYNHMLQRASPSYVEVLYPLILIKYLSESTDYRCKECYRPVRTLKSFTVNAVNVSSTYRFQLSGMIWIQKPDEIWTMPPGTMHAVDVMFRYAHGRAHDHDRYHWISPFWRIFLVMISDAKCVVHIYS